MKFLLGLWVIGVCLYDIFAVLGVVHMSPTLGYCLTSVVPILMCDVVGYFSMEKYLLALMFVGTMPKSLSNQIFLRRAFVLCADHR